MVNAVKSPSISAIMAVSIAIVIKMVIGYGSAISACQLQPAHQLAIGVENRFSVHIEAIDVGGVYFKVGDKYVKSSHEDAHVLSGVEGYKRDVAYTEFQLIITNRTMDDVVIARQYLQAILGRVLLVDSDSRTWKLEQEFMYRSITDINFDLVLAKGSSKSLRFEFAPARLWPEDLDTRAEIHEYPEVLWPMLPDEPKLRVRKVDNAKVHEPVPMPIIFDNLPANIKTSGL
ncbi:MAG: hypothetical protein KIT54_07795 [Phycisphaeraceae bacterium]|nr:hypothetical protein [Phycisphaeraceae bacterium]